MRITIYDKDRQFVGQEGAPLVARVTPRVFPLIGTAVLVVPLDSPQAANLMAPGARVVFEENGDTVLSGPVDEISTDTASDELEVVVVDDTELLWRVLGFQYTGGIGFQYTAHYKNYTGKAETVIKNVVRDNLVTRLRLPGFVVAPDLGRGAELAGGATYRMHPIPDRVYPGLDMAGIGVRVRQVGTQLVMDTYVPRVYPTVLSVQGRTLKAAKYNRRRPTASRAIVGGPGEAKARRYAEIRETGREAEWGFLGETFRDARDVQQTEGETTWTRVDADLRSRGEETLTESGAVHGLSVTLAESSIFTYGPGGIQVGDIVRVDIRGTIIQDTVKEATLEWVTPTYTRAVPTIGEQTDPDTRRAKTLAALKQSQRQEERA